MGKVKVAFTTLGCRMNQFETSALEEKFSERGYTITNFEDTADIYVVNTCTVTKDADRTSRKILRQAKRKNPNAVVVATGCYAQISPEDLSRMEEVDIVAGNSHKTDLLEIVESYINERNEDKVFIDNIFREKDFKTFSISTFFEGTRPILKVQEGCNSFCSFCIIPFARGRVRSGKVREILEQVRILVDRGYREIVLTGTQLSQYGFDHREANLLTLLKEITKIENLYLVRLSSMGIDELDNEMIDFLTDNQKIAPHFHLSLQSADDRVLSDMRRNYTVSDYIRKVERMLKRRPETAIGTDIITGFPTEDREAFKNTVKNVKDIPFAYIHVFTYSPRENTQAFKLKDTVPPQEKKKRTKIMIDVSKEKSFRFRERFLNSKLKFLIIGQKDGKSIGLSPNYIHASLPVELEYNSIVEGKLVRIGLDREDNTAEVVHAFNHI
ncbi:MAG: tRNA (N(6)-L-threonylcarbamoyladenosine(37)-C(2))-methylthiotransferase MtaB [Hydrogenothermaceae bacterium]|nr:tRNA (N(6)-L-threonylcarbamoyladenosine(37)-C(2))-methylthiotransferase MtaB [Hydrogenothermaceae bacterium]